MEQGTKEDRVTVTAPEEEIVEESEVVELPPNIEQLNARLNDLREEVAQISQVINSNQKENKLFLNLGNFKFKDITESAGVGGEKAWSTGVTMVDINSDGFLDIYVCNSGDIKGDNKQNELFINNGDLSFTESAARGLQPARIRLYTLSGVSLP